MSRLVLISVALIACGPPRHTLTPPPPPKTTPDAPIPPPSDGLAPSQPTLRLPTNFTPTGYTARLTLDPSKTGFDGSIAIAGNVAERSRVIWLHGYKLAIGKAVAKRDATEIALTVTPKGADLLEVAAATPLDAGAWTLSLDYTGDYEKLNTTGAFKQTVAEASYVYSQFEATYARRVFPCVDEPDNKVPWKLTLDVPKNLVAVSNMPGTETQLDGALKRVEFDKTPPLPSYLIAFGVGPFDIVDAGKTRAGQPIRVIALAKRGPDAAWAAKTSSGILNALEDWFGQPYPYAKLDLLTIPHTVGFGAMENAGLITFTETLILNDPAKISRERQHTWVSVAAHEMAHQWFGDLVTMKFWDDIWLNEGFASWMQTKVTGAIEATYHDEFHELDQRNVALESDALVSARQIRQPIENPDDIFTAFDGITYDKGASVLNMFEHYVGKQTFQQGVREYLKARAHGNATSKDFVDAIAAVDAGKHGDIAAAFATFLDRPGAPEITANITCSGSGAKLKAAVALSQRRYVPPGAPAPAAGAPWHVPVCVAYDNAGTRGEQCTLLTTESAMLELPAKTCPRWVMPNVEGRSYYRAAYTVAQVTALRDEAWSKLSWPERRAVYFDVDEATVTGKVPLQLALSFVPKLLAGNDRFTVGQALGLATGIERWVPDDLRSKYEYWLRTMFGPGATAAGFVAKDSDTLDIEASRGELVGTVAWLGREPALIAEAQKLAERYRELPQAIRGLVLDIAVDASPALFEQVRRDVYTESDRTRRQEMLGALAAARDPAHHKAALELVLDRKLDIRETDFILGSGSTEANRAMGRAFFQANMKSILDRMPKEGTAGPAAGLAYILTASCKADERNETVDYIGKTFGSLTGGARVIKQATEGMDQCIAKRAILEPEIRGWLAGIRIPKPTPAKTPPAKTPTKAPAKKK